VDFPALPHDLRKACELGLAQISPETMKAARDEEEPVGQHQTPQARHERDYNPVLYGRKQVPQSFKKRNSALPPRMTARAVGPGLIGAGTYLD